MKALFETLAEEPALHIVTYSCIELQDRIEQEPDSWWCCIYCERFLQARDVGEDGPRGRQICTLCGCGGVGVALIPWDDHKSSDWTIVEADLRHGMAMPGALSPEEHALQREFVRRALELNKSCRRNARKRQRRQRKRRRRAS